MASIRTEPRRSHRTRRIVPEASHIYADVWFVHNDGPRWCDLTAADLAGTRRKVVVDGRRILKREAIVGVELFVLGG